MDMKCSALILQRSFSANWNISPERTAIEGRTNHHRIMWQTLASHWQNVSAVFIDIDRTILCRTEYVFPRISSYRLLSFCLNYLQHEAKSKSVNAMKKLPVLILIVACMSAAHVVNAQAPDEKAVTAAVE